MLVKRFDRNPLIKPADVKPSRDDYEVICVFNPGVIKFNDKTLLLLRVAERPKDKSPDEQIAPILNPRTGQIDHFRVKNDDPDVEIPDSRSFFYKGKIHLTSISHLRIATSTDGVNFDIEDSPAMFPRTSYETFGLEDPRITRLGETCYIAYKAVSPDGICTALASTTDFKNFQRLGIIFCPENLDVAIFPEKINDKYYALTRPVPKYVGPPAIWIASSPDLLNWGEHKPLILPQQGSVHNIKTGGSCVPFKTEKGWLEIYHGSDSQDRYSLAAALLDLDDPTKLIARAKKPFMEPTAEYEKTGFYGNVVFACGCIVQNDIVTIYYGAADEYTAAATISIKEILKTL